MLQSAIAEDRSSSDEDSSPDDESGQFLISHCESLLHLECDGYRLANNTYKEDSPRFKYLVFNLKLKLDTGGWIELSQHDKIQFHIDDYYDGQPWCDYYITQILRRYGGSL